MANAPKDKLIRLFHMRPYGYGFTKYGNKKLEYVDYFIEDLARMIIMQDKEKAFNKWLKKVKNEK